MFKCDDKEKLEILLDAMERYPIQPDTPQGHGREVIIEEIIEDLDKELQG